MSDVEVSVICNAYNHEKYIRDALNGFVMQKTTFPFEVLIHDDASTDHTAEIIREYEAKYPELIKPIYQTENQYSKKIGAPRIFQEPRVRGKYIAFCEGDDYWTDPLKLQKQYDALEAHPEVDMCAHMTQAIMAESGRPFYFFRPARKNTVLSQEDVIFGGGGYVATASLFYRTKIIKDPPEFRKFMFLDYTLQIAGALRGGILYLDECMSVYRCGVAGSWSSRMNADRSKLKVHFEKVQEMLQILNEETGGKYESVITMKVLANDVYQMEAKRPISLLFSEKYAKHFGKLSMKNRMQMIETFWPLVAKIKRRVRTIIYGK